MKRENRPYAVVQLWVEEGRVKHKTYYWYHSPKSARAAVNRLNKQAAPGHVYQVVERQP